MSGGGGAIRTYSCRAINSVFTVSEAHTAAAHCPWHGRRVCVELVAWGDEGPSPEAVVGTAEVQEKPATTPLPPPGPSGAWVREVVFDDKARERVLSLMEAFEWALTREEQVGALERLVSFVESRGDHEVAAANRGPS